MLSSLVTVLCASVLLCRLEHLIIIPVDCEVKSEVVVASMPVWK